MFNVFKDNKIFLFSVFLAFLFWLGESLLHAVFFDEEKHFELIPHDADELWMRIVISLLVILMGFLVGRYVQLQKKIHQEKIRTLEASMVSMNEVVGNTLSLMSHYCDEYIKTGKIEMDSAKSMKEIIDETFSALNHLQDINKMIEREQYQEKIRQD
ncbi:MAG: hypothetical protein OEY78_10300 [Gammaproteobacteria bacterium]|nr:hypothetical protein [Gammaproteobacteria bacterium]